jgi:hypothetical protein
LDYNARKRYIYSNGILEEAIGGRKGGKKSHAAILCMLVLLFDHPPGGFFSSTKKHFPHKIWEPTIFGIRLPENAFYFPF